MAGIYVHIPFCRRKCFYCDFYKTTSLGGKPLFLEVLSEEIREQASYLEGEPVETIYLGGGTPSVLSPTEAKSILSNIIQIFAVQPGAEITIEVNPDDLSPFYLASLRETGFNRLSIGIQSFSDSDLVKMNRRHTAQQALQSVQDASNAGFTDISIDMIFGFPGLSARQWRENLVIAVSLPVNHISAYHLTYHEGTPFYKWLKKGTITELYEDESIEQFEILTEMTAEAGFEQYEISNFARNQAYSRHNSSYWLGKLYLGLGPSAHSYNGTSRQWNVANIDAYLEGVRNGKPVFEREILSEKDKFNDYLITGIRTKWGISLEYLASASGNELLGKMWKAARNYLDSGHLELRGDILRLTSRGVMISDQITLALLAE